MQISNVVFSRLKLFIVVTGFIAPLVLGISASAAPTITEYALPVQGTMPTDIAAGLGNVHWFSEVGYNKIAKISTTGVIQEFDSPTGNRITSLATASDGATWFTTYDNNNYGVIARVNSDDSFTTYRLPRLSTFVLKMTQGPDGALWFVGVDYSEGQGVIGRITSTGSIQLQSLGFVTPAGLAFGADGNAWFSVPDIARICRVSPSVLESFNGMNCFQDNNAGAAPRDLVRGGDGKIWFTDYTDHVNSINIDGVVTAYQILTSNASITGLALGPDNAVWYTQNGNNRIGRVTAAGVTSEYPIATMSTNEYGSQPFGIASGTDGGVWFTEFGGNNIGRITVPSTAPIVHISSPSSNAEVSGIVSINGTISSNSAYNLMLYVFNANSQAVVSKYQYGVPASNGTSAYSWNTTNLPNGVYTIMLSAKDAQGNKDVNSTNSLKVTVNN